MNPETEVSKICEWIKSYVEKAGAKGVVLGLSGGIDSAVMADICVRALGKENVYVVMMPPSDNALLMCKKLILDGASYNDFLYESSAVAQYFLHRAMETPESKQERDLIAGNIAARMRMVGLYAWANLKNYLVIGTTNKSEYEIGYFTKFGDGACDLEPIGDYYKGEVYELAEYLEIPQEIIDAEPSADLWDGQTDKEEIGMDYEELDTELKIRSIVRPGCRSGFETGYKVEKLVKKAAHKKRMPPVYKRGV